MRVKHFNYEILENTKRTTLKIRDAKLHDMFKGSKKTFFFFKEKCEKLKIDAKTHDDAMTRSGSSWFVYFDAVVSQSLVVVSQTSWSLLSSW